MYGQMGVPVSFAGVLSMLIAAGTILSESDERPAYPEIRRRQGHAGECGDDRRRTVRLFAEQLLLDAVPVGDPLASAPAAGRRAQQLSRAALCEPPHELAALHVGRRHHGRAT